MKILAVDTALGACSAAVLDGEKVLAHRFEPMERGHAERLAPMVEEVMREAAIAFPELQRLGVTVGPGTFTGQRIGIAFMRGLRVALKCPLTGVTTLEAMARQAMAETGRRMGVALHDARRGEVYLGACENGRERIAPKLEAVCDATGDVKQLALCESLILCGTAAERVLELLADPSIALSSVRQPDALWVARLALEKPATKDAPKPLYLRPSDARLPVR